jgi:formylglycine-generating enzyme required for sulfatase activity
VTPLGIVGLAGGVAEWTLDAYEDYAGPCWASAPVTGAVCWKQSAQQRAFRGGSWAAPPTILPSVVRQGAKPTASTSIVGFRCVYPSPG